LDAGSCQVIEVGNQSGIETASASLISEGGVGEAVTQNNGSGRKSRADDFLNMLGPGRSIKEKLGTGDQGAAVRVEQNAANGISDGTAARFTRHHDLMAGQFEAVTESADLGGLSAPLDPFKRDKKTSISHDPHFNRGIIGMTSSRSKKNLMFAAFAKVDSCLLEGGFLLLLAR